MQIFFNELNKYCTFFLRDAAETLPRGYRDDTLTLNTIKNDTFYTF